MNNCSIFAQNTLANSKYCFLAQAPIKQGAFLFNCLTINFFKVIILLEVKL